MYGLFYIIFWIAAPQAACNDGRVFTNNKWIASSCFALLAMTESIIIIFVCVDYFLFGTYRNNKRNVRMMKSVDCFVITFPAITK
jgi:hypothetical protein